MSAKEYLRQAFYIDSQINSKLDQIASMRELLDKTGAVLSDMPKSPNKPSSQMEENIVKIVALEAEINSDINKLIQLKHEIMKTIKKVDSPECQMLLELRYLCFKTWEEIACEMGFTVRNVHMLHSKALKNIKVPR